MKALLELSALEILTETSFAFLLTATPPMKSKKGSKKRAAALDPDLPTVKDIVELGKGSYTRHKTRSTVWDF